MSLQKSSYIWDDWSDDEQQESTKIEDDAKSCISSLGLESTIVYDNRRSGRVDSIGGLKSLEPSSENPSSIVKVTNEIAEKISSMRKELREKHGLIKDLQLELIRIREAKDKKSARVKQGWSSRLLTLKDEHQQSFRKVEDFIHKLGSDIAKLKEQIGLLEGKAATNREQHLQAVEHTRMELSRRLSKVRRQWEVDERASFNKVLLSKAEALQKQAADSLGPKIDRLVAGGKEKVMQLRSDHDVKLSKIRIDAIAKNEEKINSAKLRLSDQIAEEMDRLRGSLSKANSDLAKNNSRELSLLKDKFQQELQSLTTSSEYDMRAEGEQHQAAVAALIRHEKVQVEELLLAQQKEIDLLQSGFQDEAKKTKLVLRDKVLMSQQRALELKEKLRQTHLLRLQDGIKHKIEVETEKILSKLMENAKEERRSIQKKIDDEISDLRLQLQEEHDRKARKEQEDCQQLSLLRGTIDGYNDQAARLTRSIEATSKQIRDLSDALLMQRDDLHAVERESNQLASRHECEVNERKAQIGGDINSLEQKLDLLNEQLRAQSLEQSSSRDKAERDYLSDLGRIKDKISILLKKKDSTYSENEVRLQQLQARSVQLQSELEDLRDQAFGV